MFGNFGFTEMVFIFGLALLIFGPRELPKIGRTLGQAMNQFKRASEEFKRTWEAEVENETTRAAATPSTPSEPVAYTPPDEFPPFHSPIPETPGDAFSAGSEPEIAAPAESIARGPVATRRVDEPRAKPSLIEGYEG